MKENQSIVLTKRLLKDALLNLLKKKDMEKISVSELCAEAGINRATFYRHYEIPLDVLHEIQKDFIQDANFISKKPKNLQDIACQFEQMCTYLQTHSDIVKILMKCSTDKDFANLLQNYCRDMIFYKYADKLDEDSMHLIIMGLAGGGYALVRTWLLEDMQKTPKEMAELIVRFISYGSKLF